MESTAKKETETKAPQEAKLEVAKTNKIKEYMPAAITSKNVDSEWSGSVLIYIPLYDERMDLLEGCGITTGEKGWVRKMVKLMKPLKNGKAYLK